MKTATTITLLDLAAGLRDGSIVCEAENTNLTVEALADASGPDCYPDTKLEFLCGEECVASLECWKMGQYMHGPNRRDNGEYIGNGWQWQVDEKDGMTTGRPQCTYSAGQDAVWCVTSSNSGGLTLTVSSDEENDAETLAAIETITNAINTAYDEIDVEAATDDDVYEALIAESSDADIDVEVLNEILRVGLYCGKDAGRTVYTYDGAEKVWEDAEDCVLAARKHVKKALRDAADVAVSNEEVNRVSQVLVGKLED